MTTPTLDIEPYLDADHLAALNALPVRQDPADHAARRAAMEKLRAGRNTWVILDPSMRDKVTEMGRKWTAAQAKKQAAKGNMWMQKVQDSYWAFFDMWKKHSIYRVK